MVGCTRTGCASIPIISIEDGLAEGDWDGWKALTATLGDRVQLVGDDVFVTNPEILRSGIADGVGNALLVKLNQIGTVTETLDADRDGRATRATRRSSRTDRARPRTPPSPISRSAPRAGQIKTGSASRTDRVVQIQPAAAHRGGARALPRSTPAAAPSGDARRTRSSDLAARMTTHA